MGFSFERQKSYYVYCFSKIEKYNYIHQPNHGYKTMIQKCIQHIMKENLLLLKDLLEPEK